MYSRGPLRRSFDNNHLARLAKCYSRTVERSERQGNVDGKKRGSELEIMVSWRTGSNNRELDSSDGKRWKKRLAFAMSSRRSDDQA